MLKNVNDDLGTIGSLNPIDGSHNLMIWFSDLEMWFGI